MCGRTERAGTSILASTPARVAFRLTIILSFSTSQSTSPTLTESPSFFIQAIKFERGIFNDGVIVNLVCCETGTHSELAFNER